MTWKDTKPWWHVHFPAVTWRAFQRKGKFLTRSGKHTAHKATTTDQLSLETAQALIRDTYHYTHSKGKRGRDTNCVSILFRIINYVPKGFSICLTFILLFVGEVYLIEYRTCRWLEIRNWVYISNRYKAPNQSLQPLLLIWANTNSLSSFHIRAACWTVKLGSKWLYFLPPVAASSQLKENWAVFLSCCWQRAAENSRIPDFLNYYCSMRKAAAAAS